MSDEGKDVAHIRKVYEFGTENTKRFVMFPCAAEPWRVFKASAEAMARDYHVYLFIVEGDRPLSICACIHAGAYGFAAIKVLHP